MVTRSFLQTLKQLVSPLHADFQKWEHACQPLYASCCPVLLYFSRYCTIKVFLYFLCLFLCMHYWCEKDYTLIAAQYHRAVLVGYLG